MDLIRFVEELENQPGEKRRAIIERYLKLWGVPYILHPYSTGVNLFVKELRPTFIGISSHFDVVAGTPGANDNASAVAVTLEMIRRQQLYSTGSIGVRYFFFDEEEFQCRGSRTYLQDYTIEGMIGLINLEMVGMGDQLALWPLNNEASGRTLNQVEEVAREQGVGTERFDRIVTNYADHIAFREAGLIDAFTVTCISEQDREVATTYYQALDQEAPLEDLRKLMAQAPLFRHYHQPTDSSTHLSESSLRMTADLVWATIQALDQEQP
jgi:hypothetical protein